MSGKKFHFSLENVLRLRRHETEQARQKLAEALGHRKAQEQRLRENEARMAEAQSSAPVQGAAHPAAFQRHAAFRMQLHQTLEGDRRALAHRCQDEEKARTGLVRRHQDEERMQTLREAEKNRHQTEQERVQTEFLDEQALFNHFRKQRTDL